MVIFGSISYLNLLPFHIFIKKELKNSQQKQIITYKRGVPSQINRAFKKRKIDAAFISSIKSKNKKCVDLGILADGAVYSVLSLKGEQVFDSESDTSNVLAKLLNIKGKVIIGDKALKYYLQNSNSNNFCDLSLEWKKRTNLPFVFARLCYNKNGKTIKKIAKKFASKAQKIPQYYLKKAAAEKGLNPKDLSWYLKHINYKLNYKEKKALKLFLKKAKQI